MAHELGHLLGASTKRTQARTLYDYATPIELTTSIGSIFPFLGSLAFTANTYYQNSCLITGGSLLGLYGLARLTAEYCARVMHAEELECDMVAINLADTPKEKIEVAQNSIAFLQDHGTFRDVSTIVRPIVEKIIYTLYPLTHPSDKNRIAQYQKTINEQTALLN